MFFCDEFRQLVDIAGDRSSFIQDWLKLHGVNSSKLVIDGKNHVLVQYDKSFYSPKFSVKTVIAHHDRAGNSPGANDNSSAVWCLMNWAVTLSLFKGTHNVRIIFTDGEELGVNPDTGKMEQGAFALAQTFRRLGIVNDDVYVFDCVGRGTVPVLSLAGANASVKSSFSRRLDYLYKRTESMLAVNFPGGWIKYPVSYSDNASFLACGIPAVAITFLPKDEASSLISVPGYEPETWKYFHTEKDNIQSLTEESSAVMSKILSAIALSKTYLTSCS